MLSTPAIETRRDEYAVERFAVGAPRMEAFGAFADELYAGDPFWTPPDDPPVAPEAACFLVRRGETILGRACGTINPELTHAPQPTALAGWYECADDSDAARALLDAVADHYRERGCGYLLGPINGSTWHRYRVAEPSAGSPFFLDVHTKPWYRDQWLGAGFETVGRYYSTKGIPRLTVGDRALRFEARYRDRGITIRPFAPDRFDDELRRLHQVSLAGFARSPFYSPIGFEDFQAIYAKVRPLVRPEFVLLAERDGEPVGFIFAIPNFLERERRSLIIKTVVVLPDPSVRGLGTLLVEMVYARAASLGYDEVIHALMHESNSSMNVLADQSEPYRSYRLFGRSL